MHEVVEAVVAAEVEAGRLREGVLQLAGALVRVVHEVDGEEEVVDLLDDGVGRAEVGHLVGEERVHPRGLRVQVRPRVVDDGGDRLEKSGAVPAATRPDVVPKPVFGAPSG